MFYYCTDLTFVFDVKAGQDEACFSRELAHKWRSLSEGQVVTVNEHCFVRTITDGFEIVIY